MLEKRHSGVLPYSNATIDNVLLFLKLEEKIFGSFAIGKEYILEETNRFVIL